MNVNSNQLGDHRVRVLPIDDPVLRGATELYGIAVYTPKGNLITYRTKGGQIKVPLVA